MSLGRVLVVACAILPLASLHSRAQAPPAASAVTSPPDVRSIVARTIAANPAARGAQQKLLEAQEKLAEAVAQRGMQLVFSGSVSGSHGQVAEPLSTQTYGTVDATVALPLPNGARLAASSAQAQAGVRAAEAGLDRVRLDLAFRASDAYYGVLRARGALGITEENQAQAERQVADTQKRVDAGDVPPADVLKAQVSLATARVALVRARNAARVAEQALNSILVRDLATSVDLAAPGSIAPLDFTREQAAAQAAARSPDVREAQANLDAAQTALRISGHTRDPEWTVQANHTRTTDITAYSSLSTLTLNVTFPLSDGGVARRQVKQAKAQVEQARSALALAKQQTTLEAEQAFLEAEAAAANVSGTQETLRIAQESLAKTRQSYDAGLTTTRDVLDAQLALAQARNDANTAVYDLAVARARLDQAIGKDPLL